MSDTPPADNETLELCAKLAEEWPTKFRPTPAPNDKKRFDVYDLQRWVSAAARMIAEDIRALKQESP